MLAIMYIPSENFMKQARIGRNNLVGCPKVNDFDLFLNLKLKAKLFNSLLCKNRFKQYCAGLSVKDWYENNENKLENFI